MFTFISKFRTLDFQVEGYPPMSFKDYQFQTTDEKVAEALRGKRDVSEVERDTKTGKLAAPESAPEAEKAKVEEQVKTAEERTPAVEAGMRTSVTKEKKGRSKK